MDVEGVNIYEDDNAFYKVYDWRKVPTANSRMVNGQLVMTSQQRNYFELVNGTRGRSGEQIDIWSAVFGPLGKDGYFEPLFDKRTGVINKQVAAYWRDTMTCSTTCSRTGPPSGPSSSTSSISTRATSTPTT
jgi:hypothetical protein